MLQVNAVGGKALAKPVQLPYQMLAISDKFSLHHRIKVKAYQDGSFSGTPAEVLKDTMIPTTLVACGTFCTNKAAAQSAGKVAMSPMAVTNGADTESRSHRRR